MVFRPIQAELFGVHVYAERPRLAVKKPFDVDVAANSVEPARSFLLPQVREVVSGKIAELDQHEADQQHCGGALSEFTLVKSEQEPAREKPGERGHAETAVRHPRKSLGQD